MLEMIEDHPCEGKSNDQDSAVRNKQRQFFLPFVVLILSSMTRLRRIIAGTYILRQHIRVAQCRSKLHRKIYPVQMTYILSALDSEGA